MTTLVIVESPTKAKTIRNFLPASEYQIEASMGHVRDLPPSSDEIPEKYKGEKWAQLGVNVEADFEPLYVIPKDKQKRVNELKQALKNADQLLLATDEDREGESISWHLLQLLKPKVPIKRMVFHEITQEAIASAIDNCRNIDEQLVRAQETRRILDRLYGYTLSPLLWKKIARGLSAGRVQSVAVKLLVERERQRRAFQKGGYWDLKALLEKSKMSFEAKLVTVGGVRVATGADFDEHTGKIAEGRNVLLLNEAEAQALKTRLDGQPWTVANIEEKAVNRKPAAPFTTSTLQQEANRKLGLGARQTMRIAQSLYEEGYITYMRTDSVNLSEQAIQAARECVAQMYGKEYLSPEVRQYVTKSKGAQEAHEAIRPAGSTFKIPTATKLNGQELALYDLIWKRTVACQMADARQTHISVQIEVGDAGFRSAGKRIDFPGFLRAYVEGSDDPEAALENQEIPLPPLKVGDRPKCQELNALGHETQPPARFTEATLVKTLESEGVGRPSTYASIIGTIIDRGYARLQNNSLIPTFTAFSVTTLLEKHFPDLIDTGFTAKMEQTLDDISTGEAEWLPYLRSFYSGEAGLESQVKQRESQIDAKEARRVDLENLPSDEQATYRVCIGKFGPYIEMENAQETVTASIPPDLTPADLNPEQIEKILRQKTEGPDQLGIDPVTNQPIFVLSGRFGPYVQLGEVTEENKKPKRASLPKGVTVEQLTLEKALALLSLPRDLGVHPETGGAIQAGLGRFGPFIMYDNGEAKEYRSLKASDDLLTIDLARALEILAEPKGVRGRGKTATALKELGIHPDDGEPIKICQGRYGPYVQHGKVNASLGKEAVIEEVTLEQALKLLADKAGSSTTKKTKSTTKTSKAKSTTEDSIEDMPAETTAKKTKTKSATATKAKSTTKSTATKAKSTTKTTKTKATKTKE